MKKIVISLSVAAAAIVLTGCRTTKQILVDYDRDLRAGNYAHATVEVSSKALDGGVDELLWRLQAAGAEHLAGRTEQAITQFDAAEDIFLRNDCQSVFSQGATGGFAMLTNDRAFPFAGGGQDRIYTCLYKAIDYLSAESVDAARTELNRVAQHQENWIYERRRDIEAARERMEKDAAGYAKENKSEKGDAGDGVSKAFADASFTGEVKSHTGFDPAVDGNLETLSQKDYLNVYAQHVCGVFRWITDGDGSDYLKGLSDINGGCELLARDQREATGRARPVNQVWLYVEDGLAPCREEWRIDLPLALIPFVGRYVLYAGMALPYLCYREPACDSYAVVTSVGESQLSLIQDMDLLLKVEHDVYLRGALEREITRVIVKAGAQVALGIAYENCGNDWKKQLAIKSSQVAAAAYAASVTQADLRSWTSLPKRVFATRVVRPADGKILLKGDGANVVEIVVPEGNTMAFVSKPSRGAAASVKLHTFR